MTFAEGRYGLVATATGPWTEVETRAALDASVGEIDLNRYQGWEPTTVQFLRSFPLLRALRLLAFELGDVEPIHALSALEMLQLTTGPRTPLRLAELPALLRCSINWQSGTESIFACERLRSLLISDYPGISSGPFGRLGGLHYLEFRDGGLVEIRALGRLARVEAMRISGLRKLRSLDGIQDMTALRRLELHSSRFGGSLEPLSALHDLRRIALNSVGRIDSLAPLAHLAALEEFWMDGTTDVADGDLSVLLSMPSLKFVGFNGRPHYSHMMRDFPDRLKGTPTSPGGHPYYA